MTIRFVALVLSCTGALTGCQPSGSHYDAEASRAFRAAWDKRRAGDEAGYRTQLAEVAKKKGTFAGDRAALDLEVIDEPATIGAWETIVRQAAQYLAKPKPRPDADGEPPALPTEP